MNLGTADVVATPGEALDRALIEGLLTVSRPLEGSSSSGQMRRVSSSQEPSGNGGPTLEERCQTSTP
jgi:hypothetical protein